MQSSALAVLVLVTSFFSSSCGTDPQPGPTCTPVEADAGCAPLYDPTFEQVFTRTLKPSCAASGVSCHASTGRQGGLAFADIDESYRLLTQENGTVVAGDPSCSRVVARIVNTNGKFRMPPGRSLDPAEQCSIIQWIARGAKR
jgi:Planctomycete cytochrome C